MSCEQTHTHHEQVHNECNIHIVGRIEKEEETNKSFSLPLKENNDVEKKNVSTTINRIGAHKIVQRHRQPLIGIN